MTSASKAWPFLIASDVSLEPIIDDVEADLGEAVVSAIRATGAYHHVVGYLAECKLSGGIDTIPLADGDADVLASIIRAWELSYEGQTRGALRPGQQWGPNGMRYVMAQA
jgi:hypothetical protein